MTKELKVVAVEEVPVVVDDNLKVLTEQPTVNDSSAGLACMYADLAPLAARLRSAAVPLLFFSLLFIGSLEGMFGLVAACGVLCCAAPGSLGTAYAARCTRITATISATLALMHMFCLSTFAFAVMPEMPAALHQLCHQAEHGMGAEPPRPMLLDAPSRGDASVIVSSSIESFDVFEASNDAGDEMLVAIPSSSATMVATIVTSTARRLQEVVSEPPLEDPTACRRAERAFVQAAPTLVLFALIIQFGLFVTSMTVAKLSTRLVLAARKYGANAI